MLVYGIFCYGGYPPTCYKKSSSANMKNTCIDEGDVDGGDNDKVEYGDGV